MGKGGGDGFHTRYRPPSPPRAGRAQGPPPPRDGRPEGYRVSQVRRSEKFGGNATTAAVDGLQFPPGSSASQSQHPAGSSVGVEAGQDTELGAEWVLPTSDFVVLDEVPKIWRQATERATSGVPNPDSEGLGGRNEGSEKASVDQLHGAFYEEIYKAAGALYGVLGKFLRRDRSQDHNLRQKLCENSLPNGEKAGESSSKGNVAESSDAPSAKPKKPSVSKKFGGVRREPNGKFSARIYVPRKKNRAWLGTFKTEEAACRAYQVAADLKAHRGRKPFSEEEEDDLKKRAKKAGEHYDRSHHNVDSPDLAATVPSSKGKAVASAEPVSQRKSPAQQNSSTPDWETLSDLKV